MSDTHTFSAAAVLNAELTATRNILAKVGAFFASVGWAIAKSSSMQARFDKVQRLNAMSDEELAALKIRREDIVRHVYSDLYYA